jgi:hypothetical protein
MWKYVLADDSSIYKDSHGFYIVQYNLKTDRLETNTPECGVLQTAVGVLVRKERDAVKIVGRSRDGRQAKIEKTQSQPQK